MSQDDVAAEHKDLFKLILKAKQVQTQEIQAQFKNTVESLSTELKEATREIESLKQKYKIKKHGSSQIHLKNELKLSDIGNVDVLQVFDSNYRKAIKGFNDQVKQNRCILSSLIDCVKFCGVFELGHDESSNPGIYKGLIDFVSEIDVAMKQHLQGNKAFKGTSKSIQNDILDAILTVCQEEIKKQISEAQFVAIQCDETTDVPINQQLVIILRYERNGQIHERFWKFLKPASNSANDIAAEIKKELQSLNISVNQLISQSYDGTAVMSGSEGGVQSIIRKEFPYAYYVHSYAHQFNSILQNSVCVNKNVANFFANLHAFPTFFSKLQKRTDALGDIVRNWISTRWNLNTRTVRTIYENKERLKNCLESILDTNGNDFNTINQAEALLGYLNNESFIYWLTFFAQVTPYCENLYKEVQSRPLDADKMELCLNNFETIISNIRNLDRPTSPPKKRNQSTSFSAQTKEMCDILINQAKDRFQFTDHLLASKLFYFEKFVEYHRHFPTDDFDTVTKTYNFFQKEKLKSELSVIYGRKDFHQAGIALVILQLLTDRNLTECFSETVTLLKLICTIPMTGVESERCFSTSQRIKSLLRNTMQQQERLNSLAMLSIEKEMISSIADFNARSTQKWCRLQIE
ncbi:unnamed protein product [Psylliodes chrysocephalus]|uniref:HAT C-terminal dimerisation domain-containing protein n=1 Tax=Psylliodes chrysocephalus TaxID=3402493 RepID=A0A9P0D996_9CUCU|nr:unnamed protein product [Psylliodes chrysocephala]